jgi:hypothetical protein
MRIAYFVVWNEAPNGTTFKGVFYKIHAQIQMWQMLGHDVKLFVQTQAAGGFAKSYVPLEQIPTHISRYTSLIDRLQQGSSQFAEMRRWEPDIVYCRHAFFIPFLRDMARTFPTVVEINSDDMAQIVAQDGYKHQYWYFRLTRGLWLKHIRGFVHVIGELAERRHYTQFRKPSIVIGNSVDLSAYPTLPAPDNTTPNLVFIASTALWHGVDKIIKLAHHFPQWQFHLIGPLTDEVKAQLPANMTAYGYLTPEQYRWIMEKADVAIGSLAMHRIGLLTGSPLKVREYLSYGIPTIIGYQDADFPQPVPFLLTLPSVEGNVEAHYDEICNFVEKWRGKRLPREQVAHLDTKIKEYQRVEFMREILQQK